MSSWLLIQNYLLLFRVQQNSQTCGMDELRLLIWGRYISGLSPVTVKVIAYCFCEWHCSSRIMSVLADGVLVAGVVVIAFPLLKKKTPDC